MLLSQLPVPAQQRVTVSKFLGYDARPRTPLGPFARMENLSGGAYPTLTVRRPRGVAGSAAFYLHTVVRFVEQPASLYRILPAVEIFSALAALLFVTALLRALYLPGGVGTAPALSRCGLLAFFFCTCLALPQAVWQGMNGVDTPVSFPLAITLGCTGLLGAACARNIARRG